MALEKVVRPAETTLVTPPRRVVRASQGPRERVELKMGSAGSGKTLTGSVSETITVYCDSYVNETRIG